MKDYSIPRYDRQRDWIRQRREDGLDWNKLRYPINGNPDDLNKFLQDMKNYNGWDVDFEDWEHIVDQQMKAEERAKQLCSIDDNPILINDDENNGFTVPKGETSAWQGYRRTLLETKGFDERTVDQIEKTTVRLLNRLRFDTLKDNPVKGLVIGNVQSGKTANMAALMAMAADWSWNFFVILSGTIENLRRQTQERLFTDLREHEKNLRWKSLEHLSKQSPQGDRLQDLHLAEGDPERYFTVCLKNSARLKKLIQWTQTDKNKQKQLRILVIDDEADQAGINTSKVDQNERKRINQLIVDLVDGNDLKHKPSEATFKCMNYIGYTATPYANVLNEKGRESLYPRSFIAALPVSNEYFGPQQIFGISGGDYPGLDIVREITDKDKDKINQINKGTFFGIPETLEDALCWFINAAACLRFWNYKKPVSMLIHTSSSTAEHQHVYDAVMTWFKNNTTEIPEKCRKVWQIETSVFTKEKFREQYENYGISDDQIRDYPAFSEIEGLVRDLISEQPSHIMMDEELERVYSNNIHVCVDNCKNNRIEDGVMMRLIYPDKDNMPDVAPAFIVIGGATLSRGLTIEGLISTYFLRTVKQADTLMQMGRWFGYRKGYELLPRIWMTKNTRKKFDFLSSLDQQLRDEIYQMNILHKSPAKYGPRIMNTPDYRMIRITAKNRMQNAEINKVNFGDSLYQIYKFDTEPEIINHNLEVTEKFICELPAPSENVKINSHSVRDIIWRNIPFANIREFLGEFEINDTLPLALNLGDILKWIQTNTDKGKLKAWNVILANPSKGAVRDIPCFGKIHKTERSRKNDGSSESVVNIGALRDPSDITADIDLRNVAEQDLEQVSSLLDSSKTVEARTARSLAGLEMVPQLILYFIDKDSKPRSSSSPRSTLGTVNDLAAYAINIPAGKGDDDQFDTVSVRFDDDDEIDINEEEMQED